MTILTALEIFTNPRDLTFYVGHNCNEWGFVITRGPQRNYKLLISTGLFAKSKEETIGLLKEYLTTISDGLLKEFEDTLSTASSILNPEGREIDHSKILTRGLIEEIINRLQSEEIVSTNELVEELTWE